MLHPGYVRYFESGIRALAEAGHAVHVAFEISREKLNESEVAARLATLTPLVTCGPAPDRTESVRDFLARGDRTATRAGQPRRRLTAEAAWSSLATTVRLMEDYLRFFEPAFAGADGAAGARREAAAAHLPADRPGGRAGRARRRAARWRRVLAADRAPDSDQPGDRRLPRAAVSRSAAGDAARRAGLAAGGLREERAAAGRAQRAVGGELGQPDQQGPDPRAARPRRSSGTRRSGPRPPTLHGVPPERVVVTGAQLFDDWFEARPSRSREEFCREVGLDPARPFVLYVGSSSFIAPDEVPFVERWLSRLRRAPSQAVRAVGVLVRPHPANSRQWRAFDAASFAQVSLWPRGRRRSQRATGPARLRGLAVALRRGGRHQHQRADRGRHRRPAGVHGSRRRTSRTRRTARCTSGIWSTAADRCSVADTLDAHVAQLGEFLERGPGVGRGPDARVRPARSCARTAWTARPRRSSRPRSRSCARCRVRCPKRIPWWVLACAAARPAEGVSGAPARRGSAAVGLCAAPVPRRRGVGDGGRRTAPAPAGWRSRASA